MDIQALTAALLRPIGTPHPADRSARAVTPASESFRRHTSQDRGEQESPPQGPRTSTSRLFQSLLSASTLDALRGAVSYQAPRPANDDQAGQGGAVGEDAPQGDGNGAAPDSSDRGQASSSGASSGPDRGGQSAPAAPALVGGQRRAAFAAYTQGLMASPAFAFARPAETLDMMA